MGFSLGDVFGGAANIFVPATALFGIGPAGKALGKAVNPKPDDPVAPTTSSSAADPNNAQAMQTAEEEEQLKQTRGQAATFLTAGGGAGLLSTGTTSRATLLGS